MLSLFEKEALTLAIMSGLGPIVVLFPLLTFLNEGDTLEGFWKASGTASFVLGISLVTVAVQAFDLIKEKGRNYIKFAFRALLINICVSSFLFVASVLFYGFVLKGAETSHGYQPFAMNLLFLFSFGFVVFTCLALILRVIGFFYRS